MRRMHVGYVLKRFPRASETFIAQEILELERQGVEVSIFTLRENDVPAPHQWLSQIKAPVQYCGDLPLSETWKWLHRRSLDSNLRAGVEAALWRAFRHPSRRGRHRLREAVAVAKLAQGLGLQHLHCHFANDPTFTTLLLHDLLAVPFSFTAHAKDIYAAGPSRQVWNDQVVQASFAVTVSENNRQHIASLLREPLQGKVRRLFNGVDIERIQPSVEPPETPFHIVSVARLVPKKGLELLLEAVALTKASNTHVRCTIVGDGPERERLMQLRAELDIAGEVQFLGAVANEQVVETIADAHVFVLPCRVTADDDRDALPTVLLEAMAAGRTCISTPVGGIPEIIDPGVTGMVIPPNDPAVLAAAIGQLQTTPQLRKKMGAQGRARVEELFNTQTNTATLRRWMEQACDQEAAPATALRVVEA